MNGSNSLFSWLQSPGSDFPNLIPMAIFLCILFLVEGLYLFFRDSSGKREKRLKDRLKFVQELEKTSITASLIKKEILAQNSWKQRLFTKVSQAFNLDDLLLQANIPWKTSTVIVVMGFLGAVGGIYGFFQFGPIGGLVGFMGVGYLIPNFFLRLKKKRRLKKFEKQLPEALGLMARSLKAGHSFPSAMQLVADEMSNPIGIEFFKTFKEYNYGLEMNNALMNLYKRNELQDLKFFITAVIIQRETGGNLVEILDKIATLIRERFKLVNQVKAMTSEGRFSGLLLLLMPPVMVLTLYFINRDYIMLLKDHPTGNKITAVALFMQLMGFIAIRKIVNIKV